MNKYRLIGEIKYLDVKQGQSAKGKDWVKTTFKLCHRYGGKTHWFPCESWETKFIDLIQEGSVVELVDYIPVVSSWTNQTTMEKVIKHSLSVRDLIVVEESTQQVEEQQINTMAERAKEFVEQKTSEHEEEVELDWGERFGVGDEE